MCSATDARHSNSTSQSSSMSQHWMVTETNDEQTSHRTGSPRKERTSSTVIFTDFSTNLNVTPCALSYGQPMGTQRLRLYEQRRCPDWYVSSRIRADRAITQLGGKCGELVMFAPQSKVLRTENKRQCGLSTPRTVLLSCFLDKSVLSSGHSFFCFQSVLIR